MTDTVLIVPGYQGSGAAHWQTWLETRLPDAHRVQGINWESPVLPEWTAAIHDEIDVAGGKVWIVAHSFGSLASAVVTSERMEDVAGVILVAPADPDRFSPSGIRHRSKGLSTEPGIRNLIPHTSLVNSLVVASENDPWLAFNQAGCWAERWGSGLVNIGRAGHINTESGFGPWPCIIELLAGLGMENLPGSQAASTNRIPPRARLPKTSWINPDPGRSRLLKPGDHYRSISKGN